LVQAEVIWEDQERATGVMREIATLKDEINGIVSLDRDLADAQTSLELAVEARDSELEEETVVALGRLEAAVSAVEFRRKMRGEFDRSDAIVEFNGGSGGTEAQDWALMLLRMYTRWAERKGFDLEELDLQPGEVAGIKSATLLVRGAFAYGHLRGEAGVHRLVRISPFDSNARRHTSFASVSVAPDIEEEIDIEIAEGDLRVDTYRSSGAGGQHVNKTDSAVRITHLPTGIVVACQNERSQHKNRARAMKVLKAKLFERERLIREQKLEQVKGARQSIDFGSQVRSYVMQPYRLVKDMRTQHETSDVEGVLDGDLDGFIESFLMNGL
jgi:peptide chain release factor 2